MVRARVRAHPSTPSSPTRDMRPDRRPAGEITACRLGGLRRFGGGALGVRVDGAGCRGAADPQRTRDLRDCPASSRKRGEFGGDRLRIRLARGRQLHAQWLRGCMIASCARCHGIRAAGQPRLSRRRPGRTVLSQGEYRSVAGEEVESAEPACHWFHTADSWRVRRTSAARPRRITVDASLVGQGRAGAHPSRPGAPPTSGALPPGRAVACVRLR